MTGFSQSPEMQQFLGTFFAECNELIGDVEGRLQALRDGAFDSEDLHAIFRAVHSIKAGAGTFHFTRMTAFTHKFETLLDLVRAGRIAVSQAVVDLLVQGTDILVDLLGNAQDGIEPADDYGEEVLLAMAAAMRSAAGSPGDAASEQERDAATAPAEPRAAAAIEPAGEKHYRIVFAPRAELFRHANEPLLLIREMKRFGSLEVTANLSALPSLYSLEADDAYISWTFDLVTEEGEERIEEVFEFVTDDCDLEIACLGPAEGEAPERPASEADATPAPAPAANSGAPKAANGDGGPPANRPAATKTSSIRVDLDRVDRLVNMVGELVITQSMLAQQSSQLPQDQSPNLGAGLETLAMHTRELQEGVMAIRMQPVKSVFSRMPRLVRDLAGKLDKKIRLVTTGENTEVDKTVIEELADPLTHMIRNSLDHGIETPDERIAAGKSPQGTINLSAEHRSGRILIQVYDDGRGLNREGILEKAIEKGVVQPDAKLGDEEIDNLIFVPGFSTAEAVTDVSGRGVGMDVVKRNILNLGGRISVQSTPGRGTRFILTLPLTLAVLDGMLVAVGEERYILPLTSIVESLRPEPKHLRSLSPGEEVISVRGDYLNLAYLHRAFAVGNAVEDPTEGLVVITETEGGVRIGIVVDELLGQQQVVIKSLEDNYDPVPGISGATILGNGLVALILDVDALVELSRKHGGSRSPLPRPGEPPLEHFR